MKRFYKAFLIICILQLISRSISLAQTTYDWTGANGTAWTDHKNWVVGGFSTANYPGFASTDIAQIGVNRTFSNQPSITTPLGITTLTIGVQSTTTLTVSSTLAVSGDITIQNSSFATNTTTNITGTTAGSITCANFRYGWSSTTP